MKREWVTLAFGVLLVAAVAAVSVWQNLPFGRDRSDTPSVPVAQTVPPEAATPSAAAPRPTTEEPPAAPRLDASVPVVHKHRFGSCEGTLRAVPGTLTYTTTNRDDGFRLAMGEVEQFEMDTDRRSLRVRRRGGRTWNFEPRGENAAALVAFHREVERGRRSR